MADAGELKAVVSAETSQFISAMNDMVNAAQDATDKSAAAFENTSGGLDKMGDSAHDAGGAFEGFYESLSGAAEFAGFTVGAEQVVELLKDIASESINAYEQIELFSASMTALTGSSDAAAESLESIKTLAGQSLFDVPDLAQAAQKMAAYGISAQDIPGVMKAAADAAEVLSEPVGSVAQAFDNLYAKGQLTLRTLPQLGLTYQDLAKAMGDTSDNAKQVLADFNALGDGMDKVNIVAQAVTDKFDGAAHQMHDSLAGAIHDVKVEWDELLESFGKQVAPDLQTVISDLKDILPILVEVVANVVKWAAVNFASYLQALSDIKAIFVDLQAVFPNVSKYLGEIEGWISKITGFKFDTSSFLGWLATNALGPMGQLPAVISNIRASVDEVTGAEQRGLDALAQLPVNSAAATAATDHMRESMILTATAVDNVGKVTVSTIAQLKELGLVGQEADPFKSLNDSGQKLFDTFERGFQGIDDDWNKAAAGIDPTKLLADLQKLEAEMQQAGDTGSTAWYEVTDAIKTLDDWMLNHIEPDSSRVGQDIQNETDKVITKMGDLFSKIDTEIAKAPLDPLTAAMKRLGIEGDTASSKVVQDLTDINTLVQSHISTLGDMDAAWVKLTGDASKYANDPALLPKIIDSQKQIVDQLTAQGAPLGDIYAKDQQILQEEITLATSRGDNASAYMIDLENLKIKQQALIDQATAAGQVYTGLMTDFQNCFGALGKGIADSIVQTGSWQGVVDAIKKSFLDLADSILNTLIGQAMKQLEDAVLKNTGLLQDFASGISKVFQASNSAQAPSLPMSPANNPANVPISSDGGGGMGGAGGAMSGLAGGVTGWMSAIGSVGTMVSSIIGNFQMAHQTDIMKSIELNTRLTAMFIIIGFLSGGGWMHDFFATALGPGIDRIGDNTDAIIASLDNLTATFTQSIQQISVQINAQGITTKDAAKQLSDSIAQTLASQLAGSSLRSA